MTGKDMKEQFYTVTGRKDKTENKIYIDIDAINLILDFNEKSMQQTDTPDYEESITSEEVAKLKIKAFKKRVSTLWGKCLTKGPMPWKNKNAIIGEAPLFDACYDKDQIELYRDEILDLLNQLGDVTRFEDLKCLKSGEEWTPLRQQTKFLMSLANAAGLIEFKSSPLERAQNYDPNPEIILKRQHK